MKHGESDVERQISIQGVYLSAFWNYFLKNEGNFKNLSPQSIVDFLCITQS